MAELGSKPMNGTLLDSENESKTYPMLYLRDGDAAAVPNDSEVGDERMVTGRVRISEMGSAKDGSKSAELEFLDLTIEEKDKPHPAEKIYPTMKE